ncbi:MAG: hypothetical protein P1V20_23280 [Verrucomicrobiales bacterium]|nr:hypothetical protein [Verrucomicrobiales bacterium]
MVNRLIIPVSVFICFLLTQCDRKPDPPTIIVEAEPTVSSLISTFLDGSSTYKDIPFSEVIKASCGNQVIPLDPNDEVDALILDEISRALDSCLSEFNGAESPTGQEKRISGVSFHFVTKIRELMDSAPGFSCDFPRTKEGNLQRSGYPDLRFVHEESGRVTYVEPKLVETGSLQSSLKTFYFTPKGETGKILDDGHHLILGIEHDGNTGAWKFLRWNLVDLANFRVRLKAEFQAENNDLYRSELIIRKSANHL